MMELKIPTNWDQISVSQYIELVSLDPQLFESPYSYELEKLAILTDTSADDDIWEDMDIDELPKLLKNIQFLSKPPHPKYQEKLLDKYLIKDTIELTNGEFLDLNHYLKNDSMENMAKACAVFCRKYKIGEWDEIILEPYAHINIDERSEEIMECPVSHIYGIVTKFLDFRQNFFKTYENIMEGPVEDDEITDDMDYETRKDIEEAIAEDKKKEKWGWEKVMFSLANNDITKMDDVLNTGLIFTFNILSMKKDLSITD